MLRDSNSGEKGQLAEAEVLAVGVGLLSGVVVLTSPGTLPNEYILEHHLVSLSFLEPEHSLVSNIMWGIRFLKAKRTYTSERNLHAPHWNLICRAHGIFAISRHRVPL